MSIFILIAVSCFGISAYIYYEINQNKDTSEDFKKSQLRKTLVLLSIGIVSIIAQLNLFLGLIALILIILLYYKYNKNWFSFITNKLDITSKPKECIKISIDKDSWSEGALWIDDKNDITLMALDNNGYIYFPEASNPKKRYSLYLIYCPDFENDKKLEDKDHVGLATLMLIPKDEDDDFDFTFTIFIKCNAHDYERIKNQFWLKA